jgi:DNA-binding NarL/FixJ family response regulator
MKPEQDKATMERPASEEKVSVLLVDDHTSIRQMLAFILRREGSYEIVGEVSTGTEAVERCRELQPRLVVLDLVLPEMSGVQVVRQIRRESQDTRMLVYSGTTSEALISEAMHERPHGFVHKEDTLQVFREAVRAVTAGRNYFTQMAAETSERSGASAVSGLTERERLVLQLVASGNSTKAIADQLGMAVKTVETHRSNLCAKLDIHDVATLTRFAVRHGLVSVD